MPARSVKITAFILKPVLCGRRSSMGSLSCQPLALLWSNAWAKRLTTSRSIRAALRKLAAIAVALVLLMPASAHADAAFQQFLQSTWPGAQQLGVSRATFD